MQRDAAMREDERPHLDSVVFFFFSSLPYFPFRTLHSEIEIENSRRWSLPTPDCLDIKYYESNLYKLLATRG